MAQSGKTCTSGTLSVYKIYVSGTLSAKWLERLQGVTAQASHWATVGAVTILTTAPMDQAAITEVFNTLHDLQACLLLVQNYRASPL
jgi:hypothetical protein